MAVGQLPPGQLMAKALGAAIRTRADDVLGGSRESMYLRYLPALYQDDAFLQRFRINRKTFARHSVGREMNRRNAAVLRRIIILVTGRHFYDLAFDRRRNRDKAVGRITIAGKPI